MRTSITVSYHKFMAENRFETMRCFGSLLAYTYLLTN